MNRYRMIILATILVIVLLGIVVVVVLTPSKDHLLRNVLPFHIFHYIRKSV